MSASVAGRNVIEPLRDCIADAGEATVGSAASSQCSANSLFDSFMHKATFFLSTGRCGTQWLATHLAAACGDRAHVVHEPLPTEYKPRRMLAAAAGNSEIQPLPKAEAHVAQIARQLDERPYVECGHPCWSSLPWIAQRLADRLRIVHLVRSPGAMAKSWVSRGAHIPPMLPHFPERELLSPFDEGSAFGEYRERWASMLPYEKCLIYWAEVNALGLRLEGRFPGAWLRLRYEDLFRGDGAARLLEFLGMETDPGFLSAREIREDQHRWEPESLCDERLIENHPRVREIARVFDYQY